MQQIYEIFINLFGHSREKPELFHLCTRLIFVYLIGLLLTRVNRRFIGLRTSFNFILFILLGSTFAAAITGNAPFFETITAVVMMMLINWCLSVFVYHFPAFERLVKGKRHVLIENGDIHWETLRRNYISYSELTDAIHEKGNTTNIKKVKHAFFEHNGTISVILYDRDE